MSKVSVTGFGNVVVTAGRDLYLNLPAADDRLNLLNLLGQARQTWISGSRPAVAGIPGRSG